MADILYTEENYNPKMGLKNVYTKLKEIIQKVNTLVNSAPSVTHKVYKALLTQDSPDTGITGVSLEIGRLYEIEVGNTTGVFTNVGAANNTAGTQFVATGTTPANWGNGTLQSFGEPVATVLVNTLSGTPVFSYSSTGVFYITLNGEFLAGKVFCPNPQQLEIQGANVFSTFIGRDTDNRCFIKTFSGTGVANGGLYSAAITIEVYP